MPKKKPIKILTLDTETYDGLIGSIKRIAIYDGENVTYGYTFSDIEPELIRLSRKYSVHVYVHNLEFDARKMPEIFKDGNIKWEKSFVINNKLATIACKKYIIHDSFKLLPMSLSSLSKDFEVAHGKLNLWDEVQQRYQDEYSDLVDFLDRCDVDDPLYLEYLGYDVMSLYEVLQKIIDISGIEPEVFVNRISTASLSRYLFKNGYKGQVFKAWSNTRTDYEIMCQFNYKDDLDIEEFLRAAYCGGRTEVFTPRLFKPGRHYDVNSLYPSQMLGDFPVGKPRYYNRGGMAEQRFKEYQTKKIGHGFVHAHVYIPMQDIPPLPVKMGKLVFPCGHVYGVWTYEELDYAVTECGVTIQEYFACVHYDNSYPVFRNFIECFYKIKEQASIDGNESLRTFSKLIQNVGYGYTGMSRDKTQLRSIKDIDKYRDELVYINEKLGYIEVPADIKSEYIQVQIAAYVTSRARIALLKALRYCADHGTVYYCDTDSIVTDVYLPESMTHQSELGKWKLEGEPQRALFIMPKVYVESYKNEKDNVKFKGISKDTQRDLDYEYYEEIYHDILEGDKDSIVVEKNRITLRSIMYMKKNDIDMSHYEKRDKKLNLKSDQKRKMDYESNKTFAHYFDSIEQFRDFSFSRPKTQIGF